MKTSVLVPVYNGETTLQACLSSIIGQTVSVDELIVVNNNSTDATKAIIQKFSTNVPQLCYVFEKRRGRGAARNAGIAKATGNVIAMTDSDCIVPPNWLEKLMEPILNEGEAIVMGSQTSQQQTFFPRYIQQQQLAYIAQFTNDRYVSFLDTKNTAFKTDLLKQYLFNESLVASEDFELFLRLKEKIRFVPDISVSHTHSPSLLPYVKNTHEKAYWTGIVYALHKRNEKLQNHPMIRYIEKTDTLHFLSSMIREALSFSIKQAYFDFVTGAAWRHGLKSRLRNA